MAGIIIHCYYTGEGDAVRRFISEVSGSGLQGNVLVEDGCLQYEYFLEAKLNGGAVLLEHWRDEAAFSEHVNGAALAKIQGVKARYGIRTRVERYTVKE